MKKIKCFQFFVLPFFLISLLISSCASTGEPGDDSLDHYDLSEAVADMSGQLQTSYRKSIGDAAPEKKRLAILDCVDEEGNKTSFGKSVSSALQSKMFNPELFVLLERERIESMLGEYHFNRSGMVDEVSTSELGKLLGAEIVLVASYTVEIDTVWEETRYRVDARIVNLETGEIMGIGRVAYVIENED